MDVGERFRESEEYELLEPYADGAGLIAGYRIEGLLSRDAWLHATYEARTPDGRRVALKLLNLRSDDGRRSTRRFQRRLALRASTQHPNLLPILDWGKVGNRHYLATPLCRAPTLAGLLHAGPLKVKGALRLLGQVADALDEANARGLVHRDLAPEQVLVEPRGGGHVLLGDFGVAHPDSGGGLLDLTGSAPYQSPEWLRGEPLLPESNVYSLTCMLVECLTGSPPYTSDQAGIVGYAHVAEPPPRLSERRPELPESIDEVVAEAMAKDPAERLGSARQLVTLAADSLGVELPTVGAPRDAVAPTQSRPAIDERLPALGRRSGLALGVALVVAFAGAGFLLGRDADDAASPAPSPGAREPTQLTRATDTALERLDARRFASRRRLATARSAPTQAAEAARLVGAYEAAGRMLPRTSGTGAQLTAAMNQTGRAYRRLASAARSGDRRRYAAAARTVRRSEGALERAIARMNRDRG
jgi:serine/threonine-protein kinase